MIAVRKLDARGEPTQEVLLLNDEVARLLMRNGEAMPANGREPSDELPEGLPKIDEAADVVGLTDRDPEFFEKQEKLANERDLSSVVVTDRMQRGTRRKGE